MSAHSVQQAVVLGCGMAGLAAAAAIRPFCERVVLLERDRLPTVPTPRRGVPQSEQLHNLLSRAQVHLEELLPGFGDALLAAGGQCARVAEQTHVFELGIRMPERDLGLRLMSAWRPVIEDVARSLLLSSDVAGQVTILEGTRCTGLRLSPAGRIDGVEAESDGIGFQVHGESVVDATGASSNAPRWLSAIGAEVPKSTSSRPDQWYVSMLFERAFESGEASFWLTFPSPPNTRGGLVSPVHAGRWCVSLSGRGSDTPPVTVGAMRDYARSLEDPGIAGFLDSAVAASEPRLFRKVQATWRRYDQLCHPVPGFLPIGDALACLNPLFGQGMSVAAWQASELGRVFASVGGGTDPGAELTVQYLERATTAAKAAWSLGALVDQALAGDSSAPGRPANGRRNAVTKLVHDDPEFHALYVKIWHLLEPASSLDDPVIAARIESTARALASAG